MTDPETQRKKREELIPTAQELVQLKVKAKQNRFVLLLCIVIGIFLILGFIIYPDFALVVGVALIGGGVFFSKKQTDYLNELKDTYGI